MYETCFNLTERPFASVPRIDHDYPGAVIDAARNTLIRCVNRGEGVALIIGPSGTGKSLLCQILAEQFEGAFQVALLASAHLDTRRSLLQAILYELNRPYRGMDEGELRLSLVDFITLNDDCSRGVVLLVDEAQHLPMRLLDEIRAMTNLMRDMQPAVRMVLAGSHVLEERFASPKLESFSQRISARCYLEAFQRAETQAYIQARISACGGRGDEVFPAETCQMVHKATDGVPRLINQVCDHVLLLAYAAGIGRIEPAHVEEAWADLQQLPTPWNAAAEPASESVIEFGGLDDAPAELPALADAITTAKDADPAEDPLPQSAHVAAAPEDPETFEQLRQIQRLLADVQADFQPPATTGPEVEMVFETPHPFKETFEEEEVIADRYAAVPAAPISSVAPSPSAAQPARNVTDAECGSEQACAVPATAPCSEVVVTTPETGAASASERCEELPLQTVPVVRDRTLTLDAGAEARPATAATATLVADRSPRTARPVTSSPRPEFGRLFAKLRRGL